MISFSWPIFGDDWLTFFIFLSIVLIIIGISEFIRHYSLLSREHIRKLVHISVGILCSISPNLFQSNLQPLFLGFLFFALNLIALKKKLFKGIHSLDRTSYGTIYFPASYIILTSFFWEFSSYITLSLILLSIADPIASLIGQMVNHPKYIYPWYDKKSIQGSSAMFLCSFIIIYILSPNIFPDKNQNIFYFSFFLALLVTLAESISYRGSDNFSVPILAFIGIHCFQNTLENFGLIMVTVIILFFIAYYFESVDFSGLSGGCIMALIITTMGGVKYLIPLCVFFVFSSLIGKIIGLNQNIPHNEPKRNISQVIANGSISLILCITGYFINNDSLLFALFLSSVSAANSDTWASELGKLSKTKPVSIIGFKKIESGLSGGITYIGTFGSLLGSMTIGIVGYALGADILNVSGIILTGFFGSVIDSILGATLQAKFITPTGKVTETPSINSDQIKGIRWINNNVVNFLCTLSAPILMYLYLYFFS